mgnify:CR=1 FL=1
MQVETPQVILGADGTAPVATLLHAADGRVTSLHYGTYDYSAACGIAPQHQSLDHPVADHAKAVMQVAAAQTGSSARDNLAALDLEVMTVTDTSIALSWTTYALGGGPEGARHLFTGIGAEVGTDGALLDDGELGRERAGARWTA